MSPELLFVLASLTTYRATRLVTTDALFERQRAWLLMRYPPNRDWARTRRTGQLLTREQQVPKGVRYPRKLGQLLECPWCLGFWFAGVVWSLVWYYHGLVLPGLWWPAIAVGSGSLAVILER